MRDGSELEEGFLLVRVIGLVGLFGMVWGMDGMGFFWGYDGRLFFFFFLVWGFGVYGGVLLLNWM